MPTLKTSCPASRRVDLADLELDDVLSMGLKALDYDAVVQASVTSTA